jgi:outer membrane protein
MLGMIRGLPLVAVIVVAGCMSTIRTAREAQKGVRDRADDAVVSDSGDCALDFGSMSLRGFVDFALTNRPSVVEAALAVADARLALRQIAADAPLLSDRPFEASHLSLGGGYDASSRRASRAENVGWRTDGGSSAALSLDLLIWDWGRYGAAARQKSEEVLAAEQGLADARYAVFEDVSSAYFTLLENNALLEVAWTNENLSAEYLRRAEARLEAGEVNRLDVVKARLALCEAQERTVSASNGVSTAASSFVQAIGLEPSQVARGRVAALGSGQLSTVVRGFPDTEFTSAEAFDDAKTNAPVLRIVRARLRGASASVDYAIADLKPSVTASASLNWTDPLWMWRWGASGAQTLFQGFRKVTAVDRAVVAMQSAAAAVDREERAVCTEVDNAVAVRDNAREARRTVRASVEQAKENLDLVTEQYGVGDVSRVEFTTAISQYASALGNRVGAFYRGQRAEAAIFRLLGRVPDYREEKISEMGK